MYVQSQILTLVNICDDYTILDFLHLVNSDKSSKS